MTERRTITILFACGKRREYEAASEALAAYRMANALRFVADGAELMDYLRRTRDCRFQSAPRAHSARC